MTIYSFKTFSSPDEFEQWQRLTNAQIVSVTPIQSLAEMKFDDKENVCRTVTAAMVVVVYCMEG